VIFRACSGQSYFNPGGPDWGICLNDLASCPWWRLTDKAGRQRKFRTFEQAEKVRKRVEEVFEDYVVKSKSRQEIGEEITARVREQGL